jgi:GT2 family glycosyltransferase
MKVGVVIPIHGGRDLTLACLDSLARSTLEPAEIVVVDDGSPDDSADAIHAAFPKTTVLAGDGSLWWSGGMNLGVAHLLDGDVTHVLSLNNDCVVEPDAIERLAALAFETGGLVGSKVVDTDRPEIVVSAGCGLDWRHGGPFLHGHGERDDGRFAEPVEVECLPGMGVLIPRGVFEAIGLYDTASFPHYAGDYDFALRARWAGFPLWVEPRAVMANDRRQRGLGLDAETFSVRAVIEGLVSRRSRINVATTLRFHARHCPALHRPASLAWLYYRYFGRAAKLLALRTAARFA